MNTPVVARRSALMGLHSWLCTHGDATTIITDVAVFSALSATMAFLSTGWLEGDACTHFMFARAAWTSPAYLVNVWGRPICTGLYAIPAHLGGRPAARLTSLGLAIGMALLGWVIARRQGWRWPVLAVVFTFAQPLVFLHSFSELTELPFACLMTLAVLAYQRRQWFWLAVVIGLTPLSRPEGFAFVLLAGAALLLHRRARWWPVLGAPLVGWDLLGWHLYGRPGHWWAWLAANWPYAGDSLYDRGNLLKFVGMLPAVVGPLVFPATLVGLWLCWTGRVADPRDRSRPWQWFVADHRRRCDVVIAAVPTAVLVGHSLLTALGKMASNGEVRYMLIAAPFWALLATRGWGWAWDQLGWRHVRLAASLAAVLPVGLNRAYGVLPQRLMPDWVEAGRIADWYRDGDASRQYPRLALAHPGLLYALDLSPADRRIVDWHQGLIDTVPPGTLLVWDRVNGLFNADARRSIPLAELRRDGWVEFDTPFTGGAGEWHFFHSPGGRPAR